MAPPLRGIRVLDMGLIGVGPWAASLLGALGADVIKIERPGGDPIHFQPPKQRGLATSYTFFNFFKRSVELNLKSPSDKEAFVRLVREADVVMENMRPGRLGALGFSYEELQRINPRIIYVTCPAWGEQGPLSAVPAMDTHVQVFSGFAGITGESNGVPQTTRYPVLDFIAASYMTGAVLLALIARERTGQAQRVGLSHFGSALSIQTTRLAEFFIQERQPERKGSASSVAAPDEAFLCEDGKYLAVSVMNEEQWQALCEALGQERLIQDPKYADMRSRVSYRAELSEALGCVFRTKPSRWWSVCLKEKGVPTSVFYVSETVMNHVQSSTNDYIASVHIPHQGRFYYTPPPWRFSKTPLISGTAPYPGQHTDEVVTAGFGRSGSPVVTRGEASPQGGNDVPPLQGIRVLELAEGACGPMLGHLLAYAGAEVTKLETLKGDAARRWAPTAMTGDSVSFLALNANKRSVAIDTQHPLAMEAFKHIAANTDLVIEAWPWTDTKQVKLSYESVCTVNPGVIWCSISGFGRKGPLKDCLPAELVIQAASGWWTSLGALDQPPIRMGADVASLGTAALAFIATLAGLLHRISTGEGQHIETSMFGSMICLRGAFWSAIGQPDEWRGSYCTSETYPPRFAYNTKDKPIYFTLHKASEENYLMLLAALGMEDVFDDPRFGNTGRDAVGTNGYHTVDVWDRWEEAFKDKKAQEIVDLINGLNGSAVVANDYSQLMEHGQTHAVGMIKEVRCQGKRWNIVCPPWRDPWRLPEFTPPPALGQHSLKVLLQAGIQPHQVEKLMQEGAIYDGRALAPKTEG